MKMSPPAPLYPPAQMDLFSGPADVWTRLHIDENKLADWHNVGFLSFNPEKIGEPTRWMIMEAVFLRDLMRSGLSINTVRKMLSELQRPYAIRHDQVFWDFRTQTWRSRFEAPIVADALCRSPKKAGALVRAAIAILADTGQHEELRQIRRVLTDRLVGAKG